MKTIENIIAQIEAYGVLAKQIKSQFAGVSSIGFEIEGVSVEDFNALVKKYKAKINLSCGKAFFSLIFHNEDYDIAVWSVPCEAHHPVEIRELQTF